MYRALLSIFIIIYLFTSCSKPQVWHIGVSQCSDDDWRQYLNEELLREAAFYDNLSVDVRCAHDNSQTQIDDIRYFASNSYDLIIVAPNRAQDLSPIISEVYTNGIPVVLIDRRTDSDNYTAFLGADNRKVGKLAADYIISLDKELTSPIIEITGLPGSTPAEERHEGFIEKIRPTLTLIGCWSEVEAERKTDSLFSATPLTEKTFVFAHNDRMARGVYNSAMRHNVDSLVTIIGVDALLSDGGGVDDVINRHLQATIMYPTGGDDAIRLALKVLNGEQFDRNTELPIDIVDNTNARILKMQYAQVQENFNMISFMQGKIDFQLEQVESQKWMLFNVILFALFLIAIIGIVLKLYWTKSLMNEQISEQARELEQRNQELMTMSQELEEATQAKLTFFTNVSHDFRTPLTLIADPLERLRKSDIKYNTEQQLLLNTISDNVKYLLRLVSQVLDFRKIRAGKVEIHPTVININDAISHWAGQVRPTAEGQGVTLETKIHENGNIMIDAEKLECIIFNIVSNSLKYTPVDGKITIETKIRSNELHISISDTGAGMSEETIAHIFDRFYQGEVHVDGSGIGLAIVSEYISLMGGHVEVRSQEGRGTTFYISLPIVTEHTHASNEDNASTSQQTSDITDLAYTIENPNDSEPGERGSDCPTILIIDDNVPMLSYLRKILSPYYEVLQAHNGKEGLDIAIQQIPDIIVADVMMPVMDGLECCKRLKLHKATSHIPVILLTACTLDEQKANGYDSGADSYISKPFSSTLVLSRLRNLLESRANLHKIYSTQQPTGCGSGLIYSLRNESDIKKPSAEEEFVANVQEAIKKHLSNPDTTVDDIAMEVSLGRVQLYRKLKALTGLTITDLMRTQRLNKAQQLLQTTNLTVSQICYEVGFSSPSYFTKCYKEQFGRTPTSSTQK